MTEDPNSIWSSVSDEQHAQWMSALSDSVSLQESHPTLDHILHQAIVITSTLSLFSQSCVAEAGKWSISYFSHSSPSLLQLAFLLLAYQIDSFFSSRVFGTCNNDNDTLLNIYSYLVPPAYLIYIACHVEMPELLCALIGPFRNKLTNSCPRGLREHRT